MRKSLRLSLCYLGQELCYENFKNDVLTKLTPGEEITKDTVKRILDLDLYEPIKTELYLQCIKKFSTIKAFYNSGKRHKEYVMEVINV